MPYYRTAGIGVFAGRPFKQDMFVPVSTRTLFLPRNIPGNEILYNYIFAYNDTHMGLVLDYGSVLNHHESANVQAVRRPEFQLWNNVNFRVRMGFVCGHRSVSKDACMHTTTQETRIH